MATTTPPGALSQSISVKYTKEELKDLLLRAEQIPAHERKKAYAREPAYRRLGSPDTKTPKRENIWATGKFPEIIQ